MIVLVSAAILLNGCSASDTVKGGAIGVAAGGVLGAVIGKQAGNTALGAIIGAAVRGTAGALIGHYMDQQAEYRASAVSYFAMSQGVLGTRFTSVGYGETQPVASNGTADGRRQNRHVEIAVFANDKLKDAAAKNQLH